MTSFRNMLSVALAAAAITCVAVPERLLATAPNVTYTASGTFATPPISGNDLFELQGQPFSISLVANAATVPVSHGAHWAKYNKLAMTGTVQSLLDPTPVPISSNLTNLELATGNPAYDLFVMEAPINVLGLQIIMVATIQLPYGTIPSALIHPFTGPVTMTPATANMSYSNGTNVTVLGLNGTINATIPGTVQGPATAMLHAGSAQAPAAQPDGAQPVESGQDVVQFFACVRGDSKIGQIAAADLPVRYTGAPDLPARVRA